MEGFFLVLSYNFEKLFEVIVNLYLLVFGGCKNLNIFWVYVFLDFVMFSVVMIVFLFGVFGNKGW